MNLGERKSRDRSEAVSILGRGLIRTINLGLLASSMAAVVVIVFAWIAMQTG